MFDTSIIFAAEKSDYFDERSPTTDSLVPPEHYNLTLPVQPHFPWGEAAFFPTEFFKITLSN